MEGISSAECDALGVLCGHIRQRLYPEVLDSAQRAFQSDIARVRHAAAPQPVGFGESARAAMEAVIAEAQEEERCRRLGPWHHLDSSPNISPRRRAQGGGLRRGRSTFDTLGRTFAFEPSGSSLTGGGLGGMADSLFAPINFSREGGAPGLHSGDTPSPILGRESLSSLRSDTAHGGDPGHGPLDRGVHRVGAAPYPRFSMESAASWGTDGSRSGGADAGRDHHQQGAGYPFEGALDHHYQLNGSGSAGVVNARGFGDAFDVDFDADEGGADVDDDADAGFRTARVEGGGGGFSWAGAGFVGQGGGAGAASGSYDVPQDDEDEDGMDLG